MKIFRVAVVDSQINIWNKEEIYRDANKDLQTGVKLNANDIGHVSPHLISFFVNDINAEHNRISELGYVIIKGVTKQRWGNTSSWVRDPKEILSILYKDNYNRLKKSKLLISLN